MVFASNLIYSRHLHMFLRDMTFNADVKIFALICHVLGHKQYTRRERIYNTINCVN